MSRLRSWIALLTCTVVAATLATAPGTPAMAHGGGVEFMYGPADSYLAERMQEVTDTNDVLLAVEWASTVDGTVSGVRICLDLTVFEVAPRLPLLAFLWDANGNLLRRGGASEGISFTAPCFYDIFLQSTAVTANQRYVVGFWVRGGQYSYHVHGFDADLSNATIGHLGMPSNANSTVGDGNGLYVYADFGDVSGNNPPFPTFSWENSDYLISPRFTPVTH